VDTNGNHPKFNPTANDARIVIKHRNHLSVISSALLSFNSEQIYDFSEDVSKAMKVTGARYEPMAIRNGVACLWAGDIWNGLPNDGTLHFINSTDVTRYYDPIRSDIGYKVGDYLFEDLNMDGMLDDGDEAFVVSNARQNTQSPALYFIKRP
jgi:hypothetical protein